MPSYTPDEFETIEQSAYFGMCLLPQHLLAVAEHTAPEAFKEYACQLLANMQPTGSALQALAEAPNVRLYIALLLASLRQSVPVELVQSLAQTDLKVRLLAARQRYIAGGGKSTDLYNLIESLLDAAPTLSKEERAKYLDALDREAAQYAQGD